MEKITVRYHEPGGIIWKVLPDEEGKLLVIESRDSTLRKTSWGVVALSDGAFLLKGVPAPKPWWIGLKAVISGKAIFQGYKESQSPEPKGVYAMDLRSGKISWQDEEKSVHSFGASGTVLLSLRQEEDEALYVMEVSTGKERKSGEQEAFRNATPPETMSVFPLLYTEENSHYPTLSVFLEEQGYKNTGPVEYLEYNAYIFISFYIQEGKKVINLLMVLKEDGTIVLQERLTEGTDGVGMASFFICHQTLIYIKNKISLALVRLS